MDNLCTSLTVLKIVKWNFKRNCSANLYEGFYLEFIFPVFEKLLSFSVRHRKRAHLEIAGE